MNDKPEVEIEIEIDPMTGQPMAKVEVKPPVNTEALGALGRQLQSKFQEYSRDRHIAEQRWLQNLRQYLGVYDPDIDSQLSKDRSKAYPRITRVKCISVLSRLMNLMFPGNERNWELKASPSADLDPAAVEQAVREAMQRNVEMGLPPELDEAQVQLAVQKMADEKAKQLAEYIDDQLQELGGDQTQDYISLNRKVLQSGILYGLGILRGPFARVKQKTLWHGMPNPMTGQITPHAMIIDTFKPMYEFLPVWDFYPDMSAKNFAGMDGYFIRMVMSRTQVRELADRPDFMEDQVEKYLQRNQQGNYKAQTYEQLLRTMGVKVNVNDQKSDSSKYEVLAWFGAVSMKTLKECGCEVPEDMESEDLQAEVWMIDGHVIKADMNPWERMGIKVPTIHTFLFDEDDTALVGNGLPNVIRDSQMSICAASRMLLDNASVVCGPNLEANTDRLRADQDITSVQPYKIWYTEGDGPEANVPAIRNIAINSHMDELLKVVQLFMSFADAETFVGPATGGDMERARSEPMRTAAGASMLRADAALPFKDIVRNFDSFTQSVIYSMVLFNKQFNSTDVPQGDFNVVARGATSLVAKEVRGVQIDALSQNLTESERLHVDERKFVEAKFRSRDLADMLVTPDEVERRRKMSEQQAQEQMEMAKQKAMAEIRKTLADSFKAITQGNKNSANADAQMVNNAISLLEAGLEQEMRDDAATASGGTSEGAAPRAIGAPPGLGGLG